MYDSAKFDVIHNSHMALEGLEELLLVSKLLSDGVVPNEYGTHPHRCGPPPLPTNDHHTTPTSLLTNRAPPVC